ncbi:thioredoxin domain-containing protein [Candidatus Micrarchaeota archaeon]|nr:thioredoxin domain-containing protein [Candidatus Micrarchaeota archaeon]
MVLCILAFFVFAILSVFSAKYRPMTKEAFNCVFRTITLRPCDTDLEQRIKAELVSAVMPWSITLAKILNKNFAVFSWLFVILTLASLGYMLYGAYNFYYYGNCDGPTATGACILNDLTGDYGRFSSPTELIPPTEFNGITVGPEDAEITIVEFGCFTCPYTKQAESIVDSLLKQYNGSMRYVFKPFPLPNHNNSYQTALSVLCADKQGKHWELRKLVFQEQTLCSVEGSTAIEKLAVEAGLDMDKFNSCLNNQNTKNELDLYIQQGKDSHIYATPTFFIEGEPLVGPEPISDFKKIIDKKLSD